MKVQEYDGGRERRVLAGMVMNSAVCGKLAALPQRDFASPAARTVSELCVTYYQRHGKAPRKNIVGLVAGWAEAGQDKDAVRNIERLIDYAVEEAAGLNPSYLVDEAATLFNHNRAKQAAEKTLGLLTLGKTDEALVALQVSPIQAGTSSISWPLNDPAEVDLTFAENQDVSLITYRDGLGEFFGPDLSPGGFVAFLAREGLGKSHWLLDMAFLALRQRRRVAYFQVGDMTRVQINRRIYSRASRLPYRSTKFENRKQVWPCVVRCPTKLTETGEMAWEELSFEQPLGGVAAKEAQVQWVKKLGTDRRMFALSCHPNQSINVHQLKGVLREMERDDFLPEVVFVDYADNLASSNPKLDQRDQLALTWDILRSISMERNCLLVTATQANRVGYDVKVLQMKHISEEKRKIAHVTMLIGINQQPHEKRIGMYRLNCMKNRNGDHDEFRCCYTLSCLSLANPAVVSVFPHKAIKLKEGDDE